ncbi:MAG: hypothetical protein RJQ09_12515 [Cyclobacteriaceae bacterium]
MKTTLILLSGILIITDAFSQAPPLQLVATIRQKGPVAYRDPIGVMSPDGQWFAYTDLRKIFIRPIAGGATKELKKNGAFIRYLTWTPDSKNLITYELGGKSETWYSYPIDETTGTAIWPELDSFNIINSEGETIALTRHDLKNLTWSKKGEAVAGIAKMGTSTYLIEFESDGKNPSLIGEAQIETLAWNPGIGKWAGIVVENDQRYIDLNLTHDTNELIPANSYGEIAFSADGNTLYFTEGNDRGVLDLWKKDLHAKEKEQLTSFSRDSYSPSVAVDGSVMFKLQDYRIFIAKVSGDGGPIQTITSFQSEIPYWHPSGEEISFTYGTWRRVMDDTNYPDIAQNLGVVATDRISPADEPEQTIRASYSEDQGMSWSPNLKWITFHTHADGTDDIWLMPADDASKGKPLSKGGYETGWPRWSPDGKWIVCNTAYSSDRINKLFLIGIDQESGKITSAQKQLIPKGLEAGSFTDSQWTSNSKNLVIEYVVDENHKEIHMIPLDGGEGKLIHSFESDQLYSGIGLSNDDKWVAYIAPDDNGNFQVWKVSIDGKEVKQVTFDPTDKAHPVYSPTKDEIAFSVFNYQSIFWMLKP